MKILGIVFISLLAIYIGITIYDLIKKSIAKRKAKEKENEKGDEPKVDDDTQ